MKSTEFSELELPESKLLETKQSEITWDSHYFYLDQEKFFPILQEVRGQLGSLESVNGVVLKVDCFPEEMEGAWDELFHLAQEAVSAQKWIFWDLDFHFQEKKIFLQDTSLFFSFGLAIEEFVKKLWTHFQKETIGASLFRGSIDFVKYFVWTELHEQHYLEQKQESLHWQKKGEEALSRRFFAADIFSDYLLRLASFFPDSLLPFCLLDVSQVESGAELSFLLSKERFQHLFLALKRSKIPLGYFNWEEGRCLGGWMGRGAPYFLAVPEVNVGVCLPLEEKMDATLLQLLDAVFERLHEAQTPYRVIPEAYLNEQWNGIDELIVFHPFVSPQGERKLKGFLAAGGMILPHESMEG
jgi:hypothetical protein